MNTPYKSVSFIVKAGVLSGLSVAACIWLFSLEGATRSTSSSAPAPTAQRTHAAGTVVDASVSQGVLATPTAQTAPRAPRGVSPSIEEIDPLLEPYVQETLRAVEAPEQVALRDHDYDPDCLRSAIYARGAWAMTVERRACASIYGTGRSLGLDLGQIGYQCLKLSDRLSDTEEAWFSDPLAPPTAFSECEIARSDSKRG